MLSTLQHLSGSSTSTGCVGLPDRLGHAPPAQRNIPLTVADTTLYIPIIIVSLPSRRCNHAVHADPLGRSNFARCGMACWEARVSSHVHTIAHTLTTTSRRSIIFTITINIIIITRRLPRKPHARDHGTTALRSTHGVPCRGCHVLGHGWRQCRAAVCIGHCCQAAHTNSVCGRHQQRLGRVGRRVPSHTRRYVGYL